MVTETFSTAMQNRTTSDEITSSCASTSCTVLAGSVLKSSGTCTVVPGGTTTESPAGTPFTSTCTVTASAVVFVTSQP